MSAASQLAIARGTAGDLGAIKLQQLLTLTELADLLRQSQAQPFALTFEEYSALRAASDAGDKEADQKLKVAKCAPWFVTASFTADRRIASNVSTCSALVGDADQPGTTREKLLAALGALGIAYVVHTSTSHGAGGQARYRVIVPSAAPISREQYPAAWVWLSKHLDGMLDPGAKDATRLNYMPRVPRGAIGHEVVLHDSAPLLDPASIPAAEPPQPAPAAQILTAVVDAQQLKDIRSALQALAPHAGDNETWSEAGYALLSLDHVGNQLFEEFSKQAPNYTAGAPEEWWSSHSTQAPRSDFRHLFTMAQKLAGWEAPPRVGNLAAFSVPVIDPSAAAAGPIDLAGRPIIRLANGNLHEYLPQLRRLLSGLVFTHGDRLVRVGEPGEQVDDEDLKRAADRRKLIVASAEWIQVELTRLACIQRYDGRAKDWRDINCPRELAVSILEQRHWPDIAEMKGIQRSPFVRDDGSICETPGYDPASQMFYIPNAKFPPIPQAATREMALSALQTLQAPFAQYPFKDDATRSAFLAHILTETGRPAINTAPMFFYTAPIPGTGKTALSEWAATIAHGNRPAARPWSDSPEELRKTLFASLLAGDRSVPFDNLPNGYKLRSAVLSSFLTTATMQDRKLGVSEVPTVHNGAVVSASGNNINPVADMARRSLVVRLDSNLTPEELKKRTFKIQDLPEHVAARRVDLLVAALTILRAHKLSGHRGPTPLASFEKWSRTVRDALLWLGMPDPVSTQDEETDDETGNITAAFEALGPMFADKSFTTQDLHFRVGGLIDVSQTLITALQAAGCSEPRSQIKLGYWLRESRDKIAGGYKLQRVDVGTKHKGLAQWRFRALTTPATAAEDFGDLL